MFIFIFLIVAVGIIASIPLYLLVNIFCWIFNISFHFTILKAFALCILINIIFIILDKFEIKINYNRHNKEGK